MSVRFPSGMRDSGANRIDSGKGPETCSIRRSRQSSSSLGLPVSLDRLTHHCEIVETGKARQSPLVTRRRPSLRVDPVGQQVPLLTAGTASIEPSEGVNIARRSRVKVERRLTQTLINDILSMSNNGYYSRFVQDLSIQ